MVEHGEMGGGGKWKDESAKMKEMEGRKAKEKRRLGNWGLGDEIKKGREFRIGIMKFEDL